MSSCHSTVYNLKELTGLCWSIIGCNMFRVISFLQQGGALYSFIKSPYRIETLKLILNFKIVGWKNSLH